MMSLVLLSGFLSLRFATIGFPQNEVSQQEHVAKTFFADHSGFIATAEHESANSWARVLSEVKSLQLNALSNRLFSPEKTSSPTEDEAYFFSSEFIKPGLIISDLIFPFHTHW